MGTYQYGTVLVLFGFVVSDTAWTEPQLLDLKELAQKTRSSVLQLEISESNGKDKLTGTGFLVSHDGKLITNFHVIASGTRGVGRAENGAVFEVRGVLATDPANDLALVMLNGTTFPFLALEDKTKVEVGDRVAVIGSPLGLEGTLSEGIVSAMRESQGRLNRYQISAPISPGSSGSPVLNARGNVVAIAFAGVQGGQALNFAIPVEYAIKLMDGVSPETVPQPIEATAKKEASGSIYPDPDWQCVTTASAAANHIDMLKAAKRLIERYPENERSWEMLGLAFQNLGFSDDAITAFRKAIAIKPDDPWLWLELSDAYRDAQLHNEAIESCRRAIQISPDNSSAWIKLGSEQRVCERYDEAIKSYERAATIDPTFGEAWLLIGLSYLKSDRPKESIAAYQRAVELVPSNPEWWVSLAIACEKSGRTDDAIVAYRKALKIEPSNAEIWVSLAIAYGEQGLTDQAINAYKEALEIKPQNADWWQMLGGRLSDQGKFSDAISAYRRATDLNPNDAQVWIGLALAYRDAGRDQEADSAFSKARRIDPSRFR